MYASGGRSRPRNRPSDRRARDADRRWRV